MADGSHFKTPEGFFAGSRSANDLLLSIVRGLDLTTVDQVHQSLFSPDLVREALARDPDGEVKRAGDIVKSQKVIDSGPGTVVAITSHKEGSPSANELVQVTAQVTDKGKGIGRIEWRVNGITVAVSTRQADGSGPGIPNHPATPARSRQQHHRGRRLQRLEFVGLAAGAYNRAIHRGCG